MKHPNTQTPQSHSPHHYMYNMFNQPALSCTQKFSSPQLFQQILVATAQNTPAYTAQPALHWILTHKSRAAPSSPTPKVSTSLLLTLQLQLYGDGEGYDFVRNKFHHSITWGALFTEFPVCDLEMGLVWGISCLAKWSCNYVDTS